MSEGVYIMSVASRLVGMHPQTLRKYERAGLLMPGRTNNLRFYSDEDITRLTLIKELVACGLGIPGIRLVLELQRRSGMTSPELTSIAQSLKK